MSQANGIIPPELKEEIDSAQSEDEIIGAYNSAGSGDSEKLNIIEQWFPNDEEWHGKTKINVRQARTVALAMHLPKAFEELEEIEPFIQGVIKDYLKLLTSVEGEARKEQMEVLISLFGNSIESEAETRSLMNKMISSGDSEDE